eukprot:TRINITY_DN5672_c1_g1_i1.p1 TRINITY_DN5672_c1_g1~~TRINITY_DN5672_c1_g1_i1.p1  ORF type:complete len:1489 (+),score=674.03 TRINITY_DN5672_c1_g1_i1:80-4468(+)
MPDGVGLALPAGLPLVGDRSISPRRLDYAPSPLPAGSPPRRGTNMEEAATNLRAALGHAQQLIAHREQLMHSRDMEDARRREDVVARAAHHAPPLGAGGESRHISPSPENDAAPPPRVSAAHISPAPAAPHASEYPAWKAQHNMRNEALRKEVDDLALQITREQHAKSSQAPSSAHPTPGASPYPTPHHVGGLADMFPLSDRERVQAPPTRPRPSPSASPAMTPTPNLSQRRSQTATRTSLPSQRLVAEREAWLERVGQEAAAPPPPGAAGYVEAAVYEAALKEKAALEKVIDDARRQHGDEKKELEAALKNLTVQNAELSHALGKARADLKAQREEYVAREGEWDRARHAAARHLNQLHLAQAQLDALRAERLSSTAAEEREVILTRELDSLADVIRDLQQQVEQERTRGDKLQGEVVAAALEPKAPPPRPQPSLSGNESSLSMVKAQEALMTSEASLVNRSQADLPALAVQSSTLTSPEDDTARAVQLTESFFNSSIAAVPAPPPRPLLQDLIEEEELERLRRERDGWRVGWVGSLKALHRWVAASAATAKATESEAAASALEESALSQPAENEALASLERVVADLRSKLASQAGEITKAETDSEMKAAQIQALTAANATLLELAKSSEERELIGRAGVSPVEVDAIREEVRRLEEELEKCRGEAAELRGRVRSLNATISEGEAQLEAQADETHAVQKERDRLLEQVANMAAELDASVAQQRQLTGVKDEMIEMLKTDLEAIRMQLDGPTLLNFGVQTEDVPSRTVGCDTMDSAEDVAAELRDTRLALDEKAKIIASLREDIGRVEEKRQEAEKFMQEAVQLAADAEARAVQADAIAEEALQTTEADQAAVGKMKAALQEREAAIEVLQNRLASAEEEAEAARDECGPLARSASELANQLADHKERLEEVEQELEICRDEVRAKEAELLRAAAQHDADTLRLDALKETEREKASCMKAELDELKSKAAEAWTLAEENKNLRTRLAMTEAELEAATAKADEVQAELDLLRSQSSRLKADFDESRESFLLELRTTHEKGESVESQLERQLRKNAELMEELQDLRGQLIQTNEQTEETLKAMADKSEAMEMLATKAIKEAKQARDATRTDLQKKIDALEEELQAARQSGGHTDDLQRQLAAKEAQLEGAMERMGKMQHDSEALIGDLAESTRQLKAAVDEKDKLVKKMQGLKADLSAAATQCKQAEDDLCAATSERDALREKVVELELQRKAQDTFIDTWQNEPLHLAKEHDVLELERMEGQLADAMNMLRSTEASLEDEIARNGRLENRIEMCMAHLKEAEQERVARIEELRAVKEERAQLRQQVRSLHGSASSSDREKKDLLEKLNHFGWLIAQRGAFTKDLFKLHKLITTLSNMTDMSRRVKAHANQTHQQMTLILNVYLSEIERQHLGLAVIVHPTPEPQSLSPRALVRLLEHSPLTQAPMRQDARTPSNYEPSPPAYG